MKILYVTPYNPSERKFGGGIRNFGITRYLNQNYNLHIALASASHTNSALCDQPGTTFYMNCHILQPTQNPGVRRNIWDIVKIIRKSTLLFRDSFLDLVDRVNPEVVWYYQKESVRYTGFAPSIPSIIDFDNISWRRLLFEGKYQRGVGKLVTLCKVLPYWLFDLWMLQRAEVCVVANVEEQKRLIRRRKIFTLANGYDFPQNISISSRQSKRLLFVGSLFYYPNIDGIKWFCKEIWPLILNAVPDAYLDIIGSFVDGMAEVKSINHVQCHGFVQDLEQFYSESAFLVVPLRIATGTRIKIVEAWSKGVPVISTALGAEGLGAQNMQTLLIGDTVIDFANVCIKLLQTPDLGVHLAEKAFEHGKAQYSWQSIYPILDHVVNLAVHGINR